MESEATLDVLNQLGITEHVTVSMHACVCVCVLFSLDERLVQSLFTHMNL